MNQVTLEVSTYKTNIIFTLLVLSLLCACRDSSEGNFREGEIHYKISYLESNLGKIPAELLPKDMTLKFTGDQVLTEIDGIFGYFNISNVTSSKKSENLTYLKIIDKKFYFEGKEGEIAPGFHRMADMKIERVEGGKEICGYYCDQALITLPSFSDEPMPVFFTSEIGIREPNSANPYNQIDGVLMEFYLTLSNLKMKLVAENVYSKSVSDKKFDRQKDYLRISKPTMEAILDSLMVK